MRLNELILTRILIILAISSWFSLNAHALNIKLCENAIPPWVIEDSGGISKNSLMRVFTDAVFSQIDALDVEYVLLPWSRCQEYVKQGKIDGALFMYITEERQKLYIFSDVTVEYPEGYLYSKLRYPDGIVINTYDDIAKYKIGLLRGHYYDKPIMDLKDSGKLNFSIVNNSEQNYKKLMAGRIDILIEGLVNAKYDIMHNNWHDKIGINNGRLMLLGDMAYAFNPQSPVVQYLPLINEAIQHLRSRSFHLELKDRDY